MIRRNKAEKRFGVDLCSKSVCLPYLPLIAAVVRGRAFTNRPSNIARDLSALLTTGVTGHSPACATNQSILCPGTNPLAAIVKTSVRLGARLVWIFPISQPSNNTLSRRHHPPNVFTFRPGSILNLALIACCIVIATSFSSSVLLRGCSKIYENIEEMSRTIFDDHDIIFLTFSPGYSKIISGFSTLRSDVSCSKHSRSWRS
jgi:hypothetical protein